MAETDTPTDIIVVLGCRTSDDGSPSEMLKSRVNQAAELYTSLRQKKTDCRVVVSGFCAQDQIVTEASAMEKYAVDNNLIDPKHIIKEEQASSTAENSYYSRIIVDQFEASNVHVVTTQLHMERAKIFFERLYSPDIYNVNYYECTHEMNDEERKHMEDREERLFPLIDEHIKIIMSKLTLPDGKMIEILQSSLVPTDVFNHGFTTRYGGVSTYNTLSSLNLMYSDKRRDPDVNVQENRRRLALTARFDPEKFRVAKCVHGADVWVIGDPQPNSYDALVTDNRQVTLAAPGADCPVVLFCDPVKKVCGVAHSGWRGTLAMIDAAVVDVMLTRFECKVKNIQVAIGPSIGPCCFEVGEEEAEKFSEAFNDGVVVRKHGSPRPFVDLRLSIRIQLEKKGVLPKNIDDDTRVTDDALKSQHPTQCTKCDPQQRFFSFRRDGTQFGTQVAFISLRESDDSACNIL